MHVNPRVAFFDGIAEKWDGWEDLAVLAGKLAAGLDEMGVGPAEVVVDVGCGTGNLTRALLARMGPPARVVAIDLSPRMIAVARGKLPDPRVQWHAGDARHLPVADGACDRVICYSVWPHLDDRAAVAAELRRVLRPGGCLHVWHLGARTRINEIHAGAGPAVRHDLLPPVAETAAVVAAAGFAVEAAVETPERYLVTGRKPG